MGLISTLKYFLLVSKNRTINYVITPSKGIVRTRSTILTENKISFNLMPSEKYKTIAILVYLYIHLFSCFVISFIILYYLLLVFWFLLWLYVYRLYFSISLYFILSIEFVVQKLINLFSLNFFLFFREMFPLDWPNVSLQIFQTNKKLALI